VFEGLAKRLRSVSLNRGAGPVSSRLLLSAPILEASLRSKAAYRQA